MYQIRKHFFILTEAGKPVYSRYGEGEELAPFIATFSAILPKLQSFFWSTEQDASSNTNQVLELGSIRFKCHILHKGALIYICVVNLEKEPPGQKMFLDDLV